VRSPGGEARYVVVDYKTNWLGGFAPAGAEPLTAWDYRPEAMAAEMIRAHYPLQALLYSVALHRFLRWRQPVYDPTTHLGGVLYLFLRGMCGPETPVVDGSPCGVFSWLPPAGLIQDVSDLLDRGAP
jgi:exodeoxyribonuclease V beta subunit